LEDLEVAYARSLDLAAGGHLAGGVS
jgi:hypothetical protein